MCIWDVLNANANRTKLLLTRTAKCSNHEFLLVYQKNYKGGRHFTQKTVAWSYDMGGDAHDASREIVNWQTTRQQMYKVSTPCLDDHHFKKEEPGSVGELSKVCSQMVLKCLYLARIGRLDILWSVNKLVRAITKWTRPCDKRLARLIHLSHYYRQYCHVGNTAQHCRLGLFQDSDFAADFENSKSTSGRIRCILVSRYGWWSSGTKCSCCLSKMALRLFVCFCEGCFLAHQACAKGFMYNAILTVGT